MDENFSDFAKMACDYTLNTLTGGASNRYKIGDGYTGTSSSMEDIQAMRDEVAAVQTNGSIISYMRKVGQKCRQYKIGNCAEAATLSALYLYDKNVFPVDVTAADNKDFDHLFIIVGLNADADSQNPGSWSTGAICDPWIRMVFDVSEFRMKMYRGKDFNPVLRWRAIGVDNFIKYKNGKYVDGMPQTITKKKKSQ
jgi:hypothetical protein